MGQPRGIEKVAGSGRKKGTPNKRSIFSVQDWIEKNNIDLLGDLYREIQAIKSPDAKAKAYFQLLEYCDAKRKAIDPVEDEMDGEIAKMSTQELFKIIAHLLPQNQDQIK